MSWWFTACCGCDTASDCRRGLEDSDELSLLLPDEFVSNDCTRCDDLGGPSPYILQYIGGDWWQYQETISRPYEDCDGNRLTIWAYPGCTPATGECEFHVQIKFEDLVTGHYLAYIYTASNPSQTATSWTFDSITVAFDVPAYLPCDHTAYPAPADVQLEKV